MERTFTRFFLLKARNFSWSKDPLNEYEREAFTLFEQMLDRLRELDVQRLCYLHIDMEHVNRQSVMIANKELHARNAC